MTTWAPEAGTIDWGAFTALYRHVGDNLKVGVGYNFGSFSDDLRDLTLDDEGVFLCRRQVLGRGRGFCGHHHKHLQPDQPSWREKTANIKLLQNLGNRIARPCLQCINPSRVSGTK
jgi:hypothetical protein